MILHIKTRKVNTQLFFYLESRMFLPVFASPIPRLFLKLLGLSEKNGGHVLSRYCCWREWIPLPFSNKFNFLKAPLKIYIYIYIYIYIERERERERERE